VGSTIHLLSKGLDSGSILYHALPLLSNGMNLFDFTMQSVNSAQISLVELMKNKEIDKFTPVVQDKNLEIRYSKRDDFNYQSLQEYLNLELKVKDIANQLKLEKPNLVSPIFI
jgi:methionyl-tRNA formyltransferase